MPDNWGYVIGAYGLAVVVFGAYWLRLGRREREVAALGADRRDRAASAGRETGRSGPRSPRPASSPADAAPPVTRR